MAILKMYLSILIPNSLQNFFKKFFIKRGFNTFILKPHRIDGPKKISIGSFGYVGSHSTLSCYGGLLNIGSRFYATRNLNIYCGEDITIGDDVLIGSHVLITDLSHGINPESKKNYQKQPITTKSVQIGSGCWIGDKASILPGSKIGEKSIIGANSVVNSNIPAYRMAAGNPAIVLKKWCFESKKWIKI
ncbi:acyltransferase [Gammaproteobacteria bacterium]|nr:acyltransferase [Gammaproteobacteria bacterium]